MSPKLNCIMLIDDDEPTNFLSSMVIQEANCTKHIQIEDSGERALNYLLKSEEFAFNNKAYPWPDLILLDINMPAMNGWEFLDKYKEMGNGDQSEVIIVMLTTSLNQNDKIIAKGISCITDFKHKPLTRQVLNEILDKNFTAQH